MATTEGKMGCLQCLKPVPVPGIDDFCSEKCRRAFAEGFLDEFSPTTIAFQFWRQYVLLQDRFLEIIRHVELSPENFQTFSDALLEFIRSCGAEIDSICKTLLPEDPDERSTMEDWRDFLETTYELSSVTLMVPRLRDYVRPFRMFALEKSPTWWTDYNAVKHRRATNFKRANLENALNILAGLFILNVIKLQDVFEHWQKLGRTTPRPFDDGIFNEVERLFYVRGTGIMRMERGGQLIGFKIIQRSKR